MLIPAYCSPDNFAVYLMKQYAKRLPHMPNPLGSEDEPISWGDLDMMVQLELIFTLCEWQFSGPARLRSMMNEESDVDWASLLSHHFTMLSLTRLIPLTAAGAHRTGCEAQQVLVYRWKPPLDTAPRYTATAT